eukprot:6168176-Pyramimonas_sp.AAC.1
MEKADDDDDDDGEEEEFLQGPKPWRSTSAGRRALAKTKGAQRPTPKALAQKRGHGHKLGPNLRFTFPD